MCCLKTSGDFMGLCQVWFVHSSWSNVRRRCRCNMSEFFVALHMCQVVGGCIFCISFLPLNPISSKGEPKIPWGLLVGSTAGGTAGGASGFCLYKYRASSWGWFAPFFPAAKLGHNFHAISGSDQRWHRSSESEGTVWKLRLPSVFWGDFFGAGQNFCITELWLDREKLEFLQAFVTRNAGPLRLTNLLKMAMEKRKAVDFRIRVWHVNLGLGFCGSFLTRCCFVYKACHPEQGSRSPREGWGRMKWTQLFLQLEKNTFKNPGCTGRGDACHCQGVFFFQKKNVDTPNC